MWSVSLLMSAAQTWRFGRRTLIPGTTSRARPALRRRPGELAACGLMLHPVLLSAHGNRTSADPCLEGADRDSAAHCTGVGKSGGVASRLIPRIHAGAPSAPGPEKST